MARPRDRRLRAAREVGQAAGQRFWEIRAAANPGEGELRIYGPIWSEKLFDDEVAPGAIRDELEALGEIETLNVYINSPGGDVFAGHAIYNILRRHPAQIIVYVDGLAASAASIIAMAGDLVVMPANSMMMVHNAWTIAIGDAAEMRKVADTLDQIQKTLVAVYREKSGLEDDQIIEMLAAETWMTAEEAVDLGFADEVEESQQVAASVAGPGRLVINGLEVDLSGFRNAPKLVAIQPPGRQPEPDPQPNAADEPSEGTRGLELLALELELLSGQRVNLPKGVGRRES